MSVWDFLFKRKKEDIREYGKPLESRRNPKEKIESMNNKNEHLYIKYPGENLVDVSLDSESAEEVFGDVAKIKDLVQKHNQRKYTIIHTHGSNGYNPAFPSPKDIETFFYDSNAKTLVIAQRNSKSGKFEGYFVLKKTKKTKLYGRSNEQDAREVVGITNEYELADERGRLCTTLKELSKKYNFNFKHVPAEDYRLEEYEYRNRFTRKGGLNKKIEGDKGNNLGRNAVAVVAIAGFLGGIAFWSGNITGKAIAELTNSSSNTVGAVLFLFGLVGSFIYFKIK